VQRTAAWGPCTRRQRAPIQATCARRVSPPYVLDGCLGFVNPLERRNETIHFNDRIGDGVFDVWPFAGADHVSVDESAARQRSAALLVQSVPGELIGAVRQLLVIAKLDEQ
jgi:hypothetical protein